MGYPPMPGLASQLKSSYMKIILPFENYSDHVRNAPVPDATNPTAIDANGTAGPAVLPTSVDAASAPPSPLSQLSELGGEDIQMTDGTVPATKSIRPRRRMMGA